jgi:hypothetical protein
VAATARETIQNIANAQESPNVVATARETSQNVANAQENPKVVATARETSQNIANAQVNPKVVTTARKTSQNVVNVQENPKVVATARETQINSAIAQESPITATADREIPKNLKSDQVIPKTVIADRETLKNTTKVQTNNGSVTTVRDTIKIPIDSQAEKITNRNTKNISPRLTEKLTENQSKLTSHNAERVVVQSLAQPLLSTHIENINYRGVEMKRQDPIFTEFRSVNYQNASRNDNPNPIAQKVENVAIAQTIDSHQSSSNLLSNYETTSTARYIDGLQTNATVSPEIVSIIDETISNGKTFIIAMKNEFGQTESKHVIIENPIVEKRQHPVNENFVTSSVVNKTEGDVQPESAKTQNNSQSKTTHTPNNSQSQSDTNSQNSSNQDMTHDWNSAPQQNIHRGQARTPTQSHEALYQKIIEKATELAKSPSADAKSVFDLQTQHLGRVNVAVEKQGTTLRIRLTAETIEEKNSLTENLSDMAENLKAFGFDTIEVNIDHRSARENAHETAEGGHSPTAKRQSSAKPSDDDAEAEIIQNRDFGYNSFEYIA